MECGGRAIKQGPRTQKIDWGSEGVLLRKGRRQMAGKTEALFARLPRPRTEPRQKTTVARELARRGRGGGGFIGSKAPSVS